MRRSVLDDELNPFAPMDLRALPKVMRQEILAMRAGYARNMGTDYEHYISHYELYEEDEEED